MRHVRIWALLIVTLAGCADDEEKQDKECTQADPASCADGLACEQVGDGDKYECLPPVIVSGRVFDSLAETGIAAATIVGLDANGAARTQVSRSDAQGNYELPVSVRRDEDGSPVEEAITLRVAAADYQPFPSVPRTALPIELELATQTGTGDAGADAGAAGGYRIENAATQVALIPLSEAERGGSTVEGRIAAEAAGGALVLALQGDSAASSAISDQDGAFVLFNVPEGSLTLEAYRVGLSVTAETVSVPSMGLTGVVLEADDAALATVSGNLQIVNAPGGLTTSVILVVASTFDPAVVRGEAPAGLRAENVSGDFTIADVPPGRYAVLAAFENDQLVRDPDEGIGGTEVVFVDVDGADVTLDQSFKVTEALAITSPGAENVEQVARGTLSLVWADDSSEEGYELRVYDALGKLVHENKAVPAVTGSPTVQYALNASAYEPGMLYQFRVWSYRLRQSQRTFISASEDLRGVFEIAR